MELSEKIAVITGAGSGIGQAVALEFSRARAKIVCCGRRESKLLETSSLIQEVGGEALVVPTDVTQKDQVDSMVTRTLEHFGRIDVLLNNAGSFSIMGGLWEVDADLWWKDVETILRGTMLCCQAAGKEMAKAKKGNIINISSISGYIVNRPQHQTSYNTAKAAVAHFTKSLAMEMMQYDITGQRDCAPETRAVRGSMQRAVLIDGPVEHVHVQVQRREVEEEEHVIEAFQGMLP